MGRFLTVTYTWARRCVIALLGGTVILIGVLMIVLPGPAVLVIPAGVGILGLEFACARRWLRTLRASGQSMFDKTLVWLRPAKRRPVEKPSVERRSAVQPVALRSDPLRVNTKSGYYRSR